MELSEYIQLASGKLFYRGKNLHPSGNDTMHVFDRLHNIVMVDALHDYQQGNLENMSDKIGQLFYFAIALAVENNIDVEKAIMDSLSKLYGGKIPEVKPKPKVERPFELP